jgi:hypothetical protein
MYRDQFKQNWHSTLQISPNALNYRLFKSDFRFEKYLDVLNNKNRFTFVDLEHLIIDYRLK